MPAAPLVVTLGDPAGIGPEVVAKAWESRTTSALPHFVAVGDIGSITAVWSGPVQQVEHLEEASAVFDSALPVLQVESVPGLVPGSPTSAGAHCALVALEIGVGFARAGEASALVTGPVNKQLLQQAGFTHPGQTEFVAERCGVGATNAVMMLAGPQLRVLPVTVHVPLRDIFDLLTEDLIVARVMAAARGLSRALGMEKPRLAIAGLNPHAGDGGVLGDEELRIIAPAVRRLQAEGLDVTGPHSPDAMFSAAARARYDAAVCMYHDQGLIPLKALHFDCAVNATLGLPIVRTSPDHGTAFDLAGRNMADPGSMIAAIAMAAEMARHRANTQP